MILTRLLFIVDAGHMKNGVWVASGASWEKGTCVIEFDRRCSDDPDEVSGVLVQDTDAVRL